MYGKANGIVQENFLLGKAKKHGNATTDGQGLLLFGNRIAEWREDGLWITNCGYQTNTTKNHLNLLPNVSIYQRNKVWHLNNQPWDGEWIRILEQAPPAKQTTNSVMFDSTTHYIRTDGWRGYSEPIYGVCGANDTGMYPDSPCPSDVCDKELKDAIKALGNIPAKIIICESSNVFCIHRYVIVPPSRIDEAREKFSEYFASAKSDTRLLYSVTGKPPVKKESNAGMVSAIAMLGDVLTDSKKESNDWKKRMLLAGYSDAGLSIPEDWDTLSEDEKQKRLDGVIDLLNKK